jgi:hypothetical protein
MLCVCMYVWWNLTAFFCSILIKFWGISGQRLWLQVMFPSPLWTHQWLKIVSCDVAIKLAYRMWGIPLRCLFMPEIMQTGTWCLPPQIKLEICNMTYTVLVQHPTQQKEALNIWIGKVVTIFVMKQRICNVNFYLTVLTKSGMLLLLLLLLEKKTSWLFWKIYLLFWITNEITNTF